MSGIPAREYNEYLKRVKYANDIRSREMMRTIQNELYSKYGKDNDDVKWLVGKFKLHTD